MVIHAVLEVLAACHKRGICYGDIKPANFLLKWPFPSIADPQALPDIRIADFGCAQQLEEVSSGIVNLIAVQYLTECSDSHQLVGYPHE